MADIEKVLAELQEYHDREWTEERDFPATREIRKRVTGNALELLKSQQEEIKRLQPKKGKWIYTGEKNAYGGTVIQCPICDDKYAAQDPHYEHFCRNCGAKLMD